MRPVRTVVALVGGVLESSCLEMQLKVGGIPHLRLNTTTGPIANKYREGKLKSTLKRECKERESDQVKSYRRGELVMIYHGQNKPCVNNMQGALLSVWKHSWRVLFIHVFIL